MTSLYRKSKKIRHFSKLTSFFILLPAIVFSLQLSAQTYVPDTTSSQAEFVQQCVDFSKQQSKEEIWVVHFWASWNSASLWVIPNLKEIRQQFRNKPVRFVSLSVDKSRKSWGKGLNQFEMPWEHIHVPRHADYSFLKRAFRHNSFPALFIVNTNGKVRRVRDASELQSLLVHHAKALPDKAYQKPEKQPGRLTTFTKPIKPPLNPTVMDDKPRPEDAKPLDTTKPTKPAPAPSSTSWVTHTVKPGETLWKISRTYGVSVDVIRKNNKLSGSTIKSGQKLKIKQN